MPERYQHKHRALGSDVIFTLVVQQNRDYADQLFAQLLELTSAFEEQFSRFLPDSELTKFNKQAGQSVAVTPAFRKLLMVTKSFSEKTDGLYNPFVLPALQNAGYLGSWPNSDKQRPGTNFAKRHLVTIEQLEFRDNWAKIPADSALDFGGIGKGYLLDELAEFLASKKVVGYWLSLGGDIICAGYDVEGQLWRVTIQHAIKLAEGVGEITNATGRKLAIATSGVTKRQGLKDGQPWHHIIDPRSGRPAQSRILTATVTANSATEADIYAKCIVIEDQQLAEQYKSNGFIEDFWLQT
jgi:FAD:protein FMN transferase